jgi:hypothetical protein
LLERTPGSRRATPLELERLGDRLVPATVAWTNGTDSGLASAAANWTDTLYGTHYVPGAGDYVYFGTDVGGSNTSCTVNISLSVDRVVMDSTYTATLTVSSATTLALTNIFAQYGRLNLVGSAAVDAGDYINFNGPVATLPGMGGGGATLAAAGSFFLTSATITATAFGPGAGLTLRAISFDDSGTISVGTASGPGFLTVSGSFVENPGATITVFGGSILTFQTGGSSSALADLKGTLSLTATSVGNATVINAQALWVDGGALTSTLVAVPVPNRAAESALAAVELAAHVAEGLMLGGYLAEAGGLAKPLTLGAQARNLWGSVLGTGAAEVVRRLVPDRGSGWGKVAAAALGRAGGFALRWAFVHAGPASANDPERGLSPCFRGTVPFFPTAPSQGWLRCSARP